MADEPITVSDAEQAKAAKRRTAAAKGAATVKACGKAKAEPAAGATPPPAPEPGRPVCPRCGRDDRILAAGESGLSPPTEPVPPEEGGGPCLRPRPRPLSWPDDYFCDRCLRWCGIPLEDPR